ncbi:hypothetical protein Ddye_021658 [Dipteronia dyeriana]|uniref:Uncharacterized protein n=1 Tax=Dipteronia dyeriana TaxID=168575 RepID=A0AAD9U2T5_9ROSI|nr:hypothetical protein Ddye_021658 [Dipteronia dyeriana]
MNGIVKEKRYTLWQEVGDSNYVKKVYEGYLNVFVSAFCYEGERWDLFRVVKGEFPDMNELDKYEGFVIFKLCFLLKTLDAMEKRSLEFSLVLCRALGGKVGKAYKGWDIGIRRVRIVKDLRACSLFEELSEIPPSLSIIECHQDEVWEVPLVLK